MLSSLTKTSPPIKTPTCGNIYGYRVTYFTVTLTFLLITSMLAAAATTAITSANI